MIHIITNGDESILEFEIGDHVNEQDYETIRPELEKKIDAFGQVDLLVRMNNIPDMSMGAVVKDFKLTFKHFNDMGKIAVVGNSSTLETLIKAESFIPNVNAQYFDFENIDEAWNWLRE